MRPYLSDNPLWEMFAMRPFSRVPDDGGAGGHRESTARRLSHHRMYDWLDETLALHANQRQ